MKNLIGILLLLISITLSVNAQNINDDFCEKYPLNSRCSNNQFEDAINSSPDDFNSEREEIIEHLTIDKVEKSLRQIGYINIERIDENKLRLFIQGKPCMIIIARNGVGMSLGSYFSKDEKITLEDLNNWNKSLRYSFAFIYKTKQNKEMIILETNLTVTGGVTEERIQSFFTNHAVYQTYFTQYLNEI